jgi:hypothetical protein
LVFPLNKWPGLRILYSQVPEAKVKIIAIQDVMAVKKSDGVGLGNSFLKEKQLL